ncbi:hypothetical protein ACLB2K_040539 [Fragaria x ananassa]
MAPKRLLQDPPAASSMEEDSDAETVDEEEEEVQNDVVEDEEDKSGDEEDDEDEEEDDAGSDGICLRLLLLRFCRRYCFLFDEFVNVGLRPDGYMYTVVVKSLCELKDLHKAKEVIWYAESNGCELSVVTYNVLIHGLCKIQRVWEAVEIKNMLSRKGLKADKPSIGICLRRRLRDRVRRHDPLPNRFLFHRQAHCLQAHERIPRQAHQEDRRHRCSGEARGERSQSERLGFLLDSGSHKLKCLLCPFLVWSRAQHVTKHTEP